MNKFFKIGYVFDSIVYGALLILLTVLQTTFIYRYSLHNILPDLMLGAVCCIGIYRGEKYAALFGLFSGLFTDALGSVGVSLLPLFYTLTGYFCGIIGNNAKNEKKFFAFLLCLPALCFLREVISFVNHIIAYFESINLGQLLLHTILPEYVYNLVACILVFLLVKLFDIPLNIARKRGGLY